MTLRFDERVVVVTGAGNGLGRSHALAFGARGARVVVNDIGGLDETDSTKGAAEQVVAAIRAAGGEAVANVDPVQEGGRIVQQAMDLYGRVDAVINNAGVLRDATFHKMTDDHWQTIYEIHLLGTYRTTRAAWEHMRAANYGRVVLTSSAAGLYGNFGQANYSAAKLGLVGLGKTLAIEGASRNIFVNTIAPLAASQLTAGVMPAAVLDRLQPEYVSPLVLRLCHDSHVETGGLFEVGGGWISAVRLEQSKGAHFELAKISPEAIEACWSEINSFDAPVHRNSVMDTMIEVGNRIGMPLQFGSR